MEQLTALWRTELGALRDDEAQRGNAALERLGALQTALASHLASVHAVAAQSQAEQATADQQRLHVWTQGLESMASTLQREWQQIGAQTLAQQIGSLKAAGKLCGTLPDEPFIQMAFLSLPVIPALKLTSQGLFDGSKFDFTSLEITE